MRPLVLAACFFEVGLLLVVLPWTVFWDRNTLLEAVPLVHQLAGNPYVRGAMSGLGAINVGLGVMEIIAYVGARLEGRQEQARLWPPPEVR